MIGKQVSGARTSEGDTIDLSATVPDPATRPELLCALLDSMPLAAFWKDDQGRFSGGNRALLDLLGVDDVASLVGRTDHDFHRKAEADRYRVDDLLVLEAGAEIRDGHEIQTRPDGSVVIVRTTKLPVRDVDDAVVGLMGFYEELTADHLHSHHHNDDTHRTAQIDASVKALEFSLVYQPIFDLATEELVSAEALLRWDPPGSDALLPDRFLPYLESSGLIRTVGLWVIEEAIRQLAAWRRDHPEAATLTVAANVSRVQFESTTFVDDVSDIVDRHGLDPSALVLELTESTTSRATTNLLPPLIELRERGFGLALDDFGVGMSSLSALCELPVEIVKIDRSFIAPERDAEPHVEPCDRVLRAVVDLASSLGLRTTAEGVETEQQNERLRDIGCDMVQGFWHAEPMTAAEFTVLF